MSRVLREPLLHFVILGALLFAIDRARTPREEVAPVVVTDGFVEGLRRESLRSTGRAAEDDEALVRAFLREEALVREATSLGLAEGDVIVRRRLAQKMEFLLRNTAEVPPPTDSQLLAFLRANPGRYRRPPRVTFEHVFFDRARRDDASADASAALARLAAGGAEAPEALGDPFLRGYRFPNADLRRVEAELGAPVAASVREATLGAWVGPVEGVLGVHLVRVEARAASVEPALAEVHAAVAADWEEARRDEALEAEVTRLVEALAVERRVR
jgi:hypothetical protein